MERGCVRNKNDGVVKTIFETRENCAGRRREKGEEG